MQGKTVDHVSRRGRWPITLGAANPSLAGMQPVVEAQLGQCTESGKAARFGAAEKWATCELVGSLQ
jgi:hypothetical protein